MSRGGTMTIPSIQPRKLCAGETKVGARRIERVKAAPQRDSVGSQISCWVERARTVL